MKKALNIIVTVMGMIFRVVCAILVVYVIYEGASICYDYGYRIFTEPALSAGEGRKITVTVREDMEPKEFAELIVSKGLAEDEILVALQFLLSEYKEDFRSGTFELSTAMTVEEMMEHIATYEEESEEAEG